VTYPRRAPQVLLVLAIGLVPWTIWLSASLPRREVVHHWDLAWSGFDAALVVLLAATAVALMRGHPVARLLTPVLAALLLCDAWFDIVTAPGGRDLWLALVLALCAELPVAAFCIWLTRHEHVVNA